jgi:hypothetical protein
MKMEVFPDEIFFTAKFSPPIFDPIRGSSDGIAAVENGGKPEGRGAWVIPENVKALNYTRRII